MPRTVVLKLKTADFRILTRSLTPPLPPASAAQLGEMALRLRDRLQEAAGAAATQRYRLVGVGLGNFRDADELGPQPDLFEAGATPARTESAT